MVRKKTSIDINNRAGYIFIAPWLIGFFVFIIIPMGLSFYYAFTNYTSLSPSVTWVGLANFERMFFYDEKFWSSLKTTFTMVFVSVPLRLIAALMTAMLLNTSRKGISLYRSFFYLPSILGTSVAVVVMWRQIFGREGAINGILSVFGVEPFSWIGNPKTALPVIIALLIWQFGSSMLVFLAGLKNIPMTYYEAARVDGASPIRQFFNITIPLLSPVILFNTVIQVINGFLVFTPSMIITAGGPLNRTLVYALHLYNRAFENMEMGYASAMAWFLLVVVASCTGIIFKVLGKSVYYEGGE